MLHHGNRAACACDGADGQVFNKHVEEVKANVPADQLLVYEVKEGWEPLCQFLGVPVPPEPFPHVNDTREFQGHIRRMQYFVYGTPIVLAVVVFLVVYAIYWVLTRLF